MRPARLALLPAVLASTIALAAVDTLYQSRQLTPAGAVRLARRLEPYDPLWLEEPVPPASPEQMAKVARATSIPIATAG